MPEREDYSVQFVRYQPTSGGLVAVFKFLREDYSNMPDGLFYMDRDTVFARLHNLRAHNIPHEVTQFVIDSWP